MLLEKFLMPKCYISLIVTIFNGKNKRVSDLHIWAQVSPNCIFVLGTTQKLSRHTLGKPPVGWARWLDRTISRVLSNLSYSVISWANAGFHEKYLKYNLRRLHVFILLVLWPIMFTEIHFSFLEYSLEELTIHVSVSLQNSYSCFHPKFT